MKKAVLAGIGITTVACLLGAFLGVPKSRIPVDFLAASNTNRVARICPDYRGIVIPSNIAPLNFVVDEPGTAYGVRIRFQGGSTIDITSRTNRIVIPSRQWRELVDSNLGCDLSFHIHVRGENGEWSRFQPIVNKIAEVPVDRYLFYRLMKPIYIVRVNLAICQRDVETYEETTILTNRTSQGGCINCHSFAPNHPDRMIVQCRPGSGKSFWNGMTVVRDNEVTKVDTRALVKGPVSNRGRVPHSLAAYSAWHPNGRLIAFSANDISQFFHAVGENRDVFDAESDLAIYDTEANTVTTVPQISAVDRLETFPAWSPDGEFLYFCSAEPRPQDHFREVKYDLARVSYNPESAEWGQVELVLSAADTGMSMTEPRVSPDGRWLLFCMSEYGSFPAYQPSSDLYLLDLKSGEYHSLDEVNSPLCESWHSWSSNSRWIAFASKCRDGVFARIYFSYVDETGHAHKPLVLPQEDPTYYDRLTKTYNVPELAVTPAPARGSELTTVMRSADFRGGRKVGDASSMQSIEVP